MLIQRLPVGVALSVVLLTAACGDDHDDGTFTQDDSSVVGTPGDGGTTLPSGKDGGSVGADGGIDGGREDGGMDAGGGAGPLDSSIVDSTTGPAPVGDGGSVPGPVADGGVSAGDAALVVDGGSASADSGAITLDAGAPEVPDAGAPGAPDAGITSDAGPCPINHPAYGCGHAVSANWVVFDNGLEVDRLNKRAWTPVVEVLDDDALRDICTPLALGGLTGYSLPQMTDVRTLAAGCAATAPGGSCQVDEDMVFLAEAANCSCPAGVVGPNNGKFCRPEVPDCETIWAWTHTFETGWYQHYFYDVTTGSIVPEYVGVGIAVTAKGRCVRTLTDAEVP